MYPRFSSKAVLAIYKTFYCKGSFEKCKRYELASEGVMPDADLLPDGDRLAPIPTDDADGGSGGGVA